MSDYMRKIIYLEKRENGRPAGTGGFVRLEKREGKLSVCLTVPGQGSRSRLPVYVVYEKNGELYPLLLGKTDGGETWRIQIPPERKSAGCSQGAGTGIWQEPVRVIRQRSNTDR